MKKHGFTLIELMIVVAIVAVLAAVAIPAYRGYILRSYVNEANSSIAAIKSAQESYFTTMGCYRDAGWNPPGNPPSGGSENWDVDANGWGNNALAVRPDRRVRFQYRTYAPHGEDCDETAGTNRGDLDDEAVLSQCLDDPQGTLVPTDWFPEHWYVVAAQADLSGNGDDISDNTILISAIDDTTIFGCGPHQ